MYAELKGAHSPDVEDLGKFQPSIPDDFGFLLQIQVGPAGSNTADTFDIMVCTPEWLKHHNKPTDVILPLHFLIVFEYDFSRIMSFIEKYCSRCSGETWDEIAAQVGRLGRWEFEGFKRRAGEA